MRKTLLCLVSLSFIIAEIQFSGDARFRPRYDIKENSDASSTSDLYYLYRARLNMKADIGDGWFFNTKLGTLGVAGMTKIGNFSVNDDGEEYIDNEPGILSSYRPTVSFMELYFGNKSEDWGFWAGAFPLKYNPSLDLHFYSDKLVDIPFVLFNNSSTLGFAGYKSLMGYKVNWFLSVDNNVVENEEKIAETIETVVPASCSDPSFLTLDACEDNGFIWNEASTVEEIINAETIDDCDDFTLGLDAKLTFGSVSFTPRLLTSFGGTDGDIFPMTYGAEISLPNIAGFGTGFSYYTSTNGKESDNGYYDADHMRLSLNYPFKDGKLKFFYDMSTKNDDQVSYIWMSYTMPVYESDYGSVTITPTFRLQNGKGAGTDNFDEEYSRSKIEVTTQIKFK